MERKRQVFLAAEDTMNIRYQVHVNGKSVDGNSFGNLDDAIKKSVKYPGAKVVKLDSAGFPKEVPTTECAARLQVLKKLGFDPEKEK